MNDLMDTEVVGFDLGDGETALTLARAQDREPPNVIDLTGAYNDSRQHITAVAEHPDKGVLIGMAAVDEPGVQSLDLTFKSPDIDSAKVRTPILLFVNKVREDVIGRRLARSFGPRRWVFGAPSGWKGDLPKRYAELLRSAGLDEEGLVVEVVPESRAALLYARESEELRVSQGVLADSVLIVDVGSSTTDFTSVIGYKMQPTDGGTSLGARLIEQAILERAEAGPYGAVIQEAQADDRFLRKRLELRCRRLKEAYFRTDPARRAHPDFAVVETYRHLSSRGRVLLPFEVTAADMAEVLDTPLSALGGRTWPEAFRADLQAAAQEFASPPELVLLTGGASRMDFIGRIAAEVFDAGRVKQGIAPEVAIARGLALAGRISVQAAGFRADVHALVTGGQIASLVEDRLPDLANRLGVAVTDGMTDRHVIPAFIRWRNGYISTLEQMAGQVASKIETELTAANNNTLAQVVAEWQNELRPALEDLTRPICNRWHIPPAAMALPLLNVRASSTGVNLAPDTSHGTKVLGSIMTGINAVILTVLAAALLGSTSTLILTTGPVGLVVAIVVAGLVLIYGRERALEMAKTANLPQPLREIRSERALTAKLREEGPAQERLLARQLAEQFLKEGGPKLKVEVSARIGKLLEERAADAELLIMPSS